MNEKKPAIAASARARKKAVVRQLLQNRDLPAVRQWADTTRNPLNVLSSLLFSTDKLLCWRAIEAIGVVTAQLFENDLESLRKLIRHNFWMMNDESGNVGWYAPETIGEILYNVPALIDEFGAMLLSFLDEEPFELGAHWALARIAARRPDLITPAVDKLKPSLEDPDAFIRGTTLLALEQADLASILAAAALLEHDNNTFEIYDFDTGQFRQITVASIATRIMKL